MSRNPSVIGTSIALALLVLTAGVFIAFTQGPDITVEAPIKEQVETTQSQTRLLFVGDIMLSRSVGATMEQRGDWRWPFLPVADFLKSADITFGNLETTISERGRNVGSIYSFRANPKSVGGLTYAGFDALSVANNHIGDWTQQAMEDTFTILEANNIAVVGGGATQEDAHTAKVIERNGTRFGFLGYTDLGARYTEAVGDEAGIAWLDKAGMVADIKNAKTISDVVIVSIHMGEEYQTSANAYQRDIAAAALDAGATLFIGHHPHVVQDTKRQENGYIAYSLGNFIFDQSFSAETMEGLAVRATFEGATLKNIEELPIAISKQYQASLAQ